jgi:hypothetical protein
VDDSEVYGVFRVPVRWTITDSLPSEQEVLREDVPDLDLSVDHLPKGAHSIVGVNLQIAADEDGRAVDCGNWEPPKNGRGRQFPELVPIACKQVMASFSVSAPVDASGKRVRSVQTVSVHFKTDH